MRRQNLLIVLLLILLPVGYAWYIWPDLPDTIPTHFGPSGEPDAWGKKDSIFIMPLIMGAVSLFVYLLMSNIGKFDPKRYGTDDSIFRQFALMIVAFLSILSIGILYKASHPDLPINKFIFAFVGIFFAIIGFYLPRLKPNYFAGIRLPWTLDSEANWTATHQLAGKFWIVGGILQAVFALIFDGKTLFIIFAILMSIIVLVPIAFSYMKWRSAAASNKNHDKPK